MTGVADDPRTFLTRAYRSDTFVYNVDIVGACNLVCPSCPVGNVASGTASRGAVPKGFMPYDRFAQILKKILRESPVAKPVIALYNWGEPLLHPEIGRIVRLVRGHDLYCAVSTNLNQIRHLEALVIAEPSNIKISLSGFTQPIYGRTHTRGRIEAVKDHMRQLRELVDKHGKQIDVFIGYHDYLGNDGAELAAMEVFARELGFDLRHKIARLHPLEKALPLSRAGAMPAPADRALYDLLLVTPAEWSEVAVAEGLDGSCVMREQEMTINFDGSVSLCCNVFDYANNVAGDFLSVDHDKLQAAKDRHPLCGPCTASGYPTSCGLDKHPAIQALVAERTSTAVASHR